MEVGKAKYGSGKNVFKVEKEKDNVFRILPPLGKLAKTGRWYQYYRIEWGYKGTDGKMRPFQDVRKVDFNTKMVEVESAAHMRREAIKKRQEEVVKDFRVGQATKEQVDEIRALGMRYNLDAKYYVNAVALDGKIGLLKLNSTQMNMLKAEIDKLLKTGLDPLGIENGIFFNFTKSNATGAIKDWTFSVSPYLQNQSDGSLRRVTHTMDQNFLKRLENEAFELAGMYPELTADQVEQLVKAGDQHGSLVDQFLGKSTSVEAVEESETTTTTTPIVEQSTPSAPATDITIVNASDANSVANTPTPSSNDTPSNSMSDADFLKSIGIM